jgi:hypothetical protein
MSKHVLPLSVTPNVPKCFMAGKQQENKAPRELHGENMTGALP